MFTSATEQVLQVLLNRLGSRVKEQQQQSYLDRTTMPEISQDHFEAQLPHKPPATVEELRIRANSGGASGLEASRRRLEALRLANANNGGAADQQQDGSAGSSSGTRRPRKSSVTFQDDKPERKLTHGDSFVHDIGYKREISHR